MDPFSTFLLLGLVIALFIVLRGRNKPHNLPPGPTALPIVGNILTLDNRAPFKTFLKWSKTYGPVMTVYLGPQRFLVLVGYDTVKEALVDNADDFVGRAPVPFVQQLLKGYGITISNGERWRQLRRFALTTLRDFGMGRKRMEGWIQEESRHLLDAMKETKSAPFDCTFFLSRAVSNIICALVFGQRFGYEDHNFLRLLQVINGVLTFGSSTGGQLYNIFPTVLHALPGKHHQIFKDVDEVRAFSKGKVQEHNENLDPDNPRDFIDCFLIRLSQEKDNPNSEFHQENLIASVLNLFLAGTETTSTTLRYALMLLIKHPEIQDQMQKEIDIVIGQERSPNMEDRKSLPFTDAVIHEVQRYIDLVPLNIPHYTTHQITFRGYTIPKDTVILPLLHSVLRDEEHWEKPWTFDPKHFLDKNGNFKKSPAFMPFSAGKRACVGESLARMELFLFLVSLLQHFTFTTPGGPESIDSTPETSGFANLPRKYQLIATPR
ncbi:cytochrome P450 2C20-like [Silurus meridionalis]|uniref:cytochrome P450 2C20-like n=1 Tax=Silurus meridionalis TaxID=175797 RepID=UPI001EEB8483|nr:cytochrome P450 2C20-like [Silurus meridionalis]